MNNFYVPPEDSDIKIPDVLAHIRSHSLLFITRNRLYVYNEAACCFSHIPKDELPKFALGFFSSESRANIPTSTLNEIVKRLLLIPDVNVDLNEKRRSTQHLINLRNGVYDLKAKQLTLRSAIGRDQLLRWCFTYCMDFCYTDKASLSKAPYYLHFLRTSLDYSVDDTSKFKLLSEIIGVCLSGVQTHRHMYILIGVTGSGKSVIADFLHRIVMPERAVTTLGLQEISERFNKQHLENAVINICREITATKIKDTDTLKEIIAEEPIFVEGKGKEGYTAHPHVKLFNCANQLPRFGNMDASGNKALLDRMVILRFNHTIPSAYIDRELTDKLFNERNEICSLAIDSLQALYDRNFEFTVPDDSKQMLESYHREDISLELFIKQHCDVSSDSMVHKKDFVSAYNRYCSDNLFTPYKSKEISQYIDTNYPKVKNLRFMLNDKYLWGWKGIGLRKENSHDKQQ